MKRISLFLLAFVAVLGGLATSAGAQQDEASEESGPSTVVVHRVDSRTTPTEMLVMIDSSSAAGVSLVQNGEETEVSAEFVANQWRDTEVVFVIDTSQRLRRGDALSQATTAIADQIRALPVGTTVGVVDAASSAIAIVEMTTDRNAAAREVSALGFSEGGKIYDAFDKAVSMLSEPAAIGQPDKIQTVVVFAGGIDAGSLATTGPGRAGLIRRGAQLITVQYEGGDPSLPAVTAKTGGLTLEAKTAEDIPPRLATAATAASSRLLITFDGIVDPAERGNLSLSVGSADTNLSYAGGTLSARLITLVAVVDTSSTSIFSFFETDNGLYVTLLLAFLGIGLSIFMIGSIFGAGESSLEGLLARYSGDGDGNLDEEESNIVQTALVQRAVELSESFAEDRGFLNKVEELLERARLPLRPGEAMSFYAAGIFFGMIVGFFMFGGLVGALILGLIVAFGGIGAIRFMARRRMRKFEKQLPDTLQLLAGTLRAGYSLPQGLEAVSKESAEPMSYELGRVMTEARLGRDLEDALAGAAERLSSPDFAWAVMAIAIQREVGGNLSELLMTVSDTMVARERLKGEINTLTAEGKMSAILLGGLPPGLGGVMYVMNPEYIETLFITTIGNVFLGLGVVASLIGLAWMKKVITIDV